MSRDGSDSHNRIEIKWFRNQPRCNKLSRFNALIYASIWRGKLQEKNVEYHWFKQDYSVDINSADYSTLAGYGWKEVLAE